MQMLTDFKHMGSEGTSGMLSPAGNLPRYAWKISKINVLQPRKHVFFPIFFQFFKSCVLFQHILQPTLGMPSPARNPLPIWSKVVILEVDEQLQTYNSWPHTHPVRGDTKS